MNPGQPLYPLAWRVLRANAKLWLATVCALTAASLASSETSRSVGIDSELGWGVSVLESLLYLVLDTVVACAVIQTVLSRGNISGSRALLATGGRRFLLFLGVQMIWTVLIVVLMVPYAFLEFVVFVDEVERDPMIWLPLFSVAAILLSMMSLGLMGPDVLATGRISFGRALGWFRRYRWQLCLLIGLGVGPWLSLNLYLDGLLDADPYVEGGAPPNTLADTGLELLLSFVSMVGSVMLWTALSKIYADAVPADEATAGARIADVFD